MTDPTVLSFAFKDNVHREFTPDTGVRVSAALPSRRQQIVRSEGNLLQIWLEPISSCRVAEERILAPVSERKRLVEHLREGAEEVVKRDDLRPDLHEVMHKLHPKFRHCLVILVSLTVCFSQLFEPISNRDQSRP